MIVTFVGGPLHGTHEQRHDAPNRIEFTDDDGARFVYELRQQTGGGIGTGPIVWSHTTYALAGVSLIEFFDLSKGIFPPLHLTDN